MDSDNFFGFDASVPYDEEELEEDDDYDALNDETFGSAAVGGDWEENHKQLSSLTEAERIRRAVDKNVKELRGLHNNDDLQRTIESLSLDKISEKKRLFERSGSSPLIETQRNELSMSPGNSIWSPTGAFSTFDSLRQLNQTQLSTPNLTDAMNMQRAVNGMQGFRTTNAPFPSDARLPMPNKLPTSVKTVSELEEELKNQHSNSSWKYSTMTVGDLERELSKHSNLKKGDGSQFSNTFPAARFPNSSGPNSQPHPAMMIQRNLQTGPSPPFPHHGTPPSKPQGPFPSSLYPHMNPASNKGLPLGFPPPGSFPPQGGRPGGPFGPQINQRMPPPNKGFFHGGIPQNRSGPQKIHPADRRPDFPFGSPHSHHQQNFPPPHQHPHHHHPHAHHHQHHPMDLSREKRNGVTGGGGGGQCSGRQRRDSDAEWEEWHRIRQTDEFAGLMTPREKSWLRNIQAMQLQTDNPYQDDYYFVMHNVKQQRRREEEVIEIDGLQLLLPDRGKEGKEYEPPKLENSLGKLQVASVNAPRKIIDLQVVHLDSSHPTTSMQRDMRRHRHLLMHLEKLFNLLIELDDLERKIRALPDCPTRDSFRSKCRHLVAKLWSGLISPHEFFVQILCIKKGKTLASRLLSWVGPTEVEHILATIIQNLSLLTKKDAHDKRLPLFWPFADRFFNVSPAPTLVSFSIMMGVQLKPQKTQTIPALASRLGLSMVLSLLMRGEEIWHELDGDCTWQRFLSDVVHALCQLSNQSDSAGIQPLPSVTLAVSPRRLSTHLLRCKDVDTSSIDCAVEVLKTFEVHLSKIAPKPGLLSHTSSSSSAFTGSAHADRRHPPQPQLSSEALLQRAFDANVKSVN